MSARVAALAAQVSKRRRSLALLEATPAEEPILTPAQALAAEVLLIEASLEAGESFAAIELDPDDWARIVALARKVGGT